MSAISGAVSVVRVPLNGGYTRTGRYFGAGLPLYSATDETGAEVHFRAPGRGAAVRWVESAHPCKVRGRRS